VEQRVTGGSKEQVHGWCLQGGKAPYQLCWVVRHLEMVPRELRSTQQEGRRGAEGGCGSRVGRTGNLGKDLRPVVSTLGI
jgi:hypothetical protein